MSNGRDDDHRNRSGAPQQGDDGDNEGGGGMSSQVVGWLVFILIFGVGNLILYATTGIFFIPIPRR